MKSTFKIDVYSELSRYTKLPFEYLIKFKRIDKQRLIKIINNNLFESEFKIKEIAEQFIPITDVNYKDKSYHFNGIWPKFRFDECVYYDLKCNNCKKYNCSCKIHASDFNEIFNKEIRCSCGVTNCSQHYLRYNEFNDNINMFVYCPVHNRLMCEECHITMDVISFHVNQLKSFVKQINNFHISLEYNELMTLEDLIREYIDRLINVPNLKICIMLPNYNIIDYNPLLPVSTWTEGYLFINYEPNNLKRFWKLVSKINIDKDVEFLKETYYYDNIQLINFCNYPKYLLPVTHHQNDGEYCKGKKQSDEIQIKYDLDPIIKKYQNEIERYEKEINKIRLDYSKELEKQIKLKTDDLEKHYLNQLSKIKSEFDKIIKQKENEIVELKTKRTQLNELPSADDFVITKLKSENETLETENELITTQFKKMKEDYEKVLSEKADMNNEIAKLKAKIDKKTQIIRKLTDTLDTEQVLNELPPSKEEMAISKLKPSSLEMPIVYVQN